MDKRSNQLKYSGDQKARDLVSNIKFSQPNARILNRSQPNAKTEYGTPYTKPSETPIKTESENSIFLFVVVYTYSQINDQVEANIIDVFESLGKKSETGSTFSNSFKLAKTYGENTEFDNTINAKNYITVEAEGTLVQSKITKKQTGTPRTFNINEGHKYNQYADFELLFEPRDDDQCIFFYEYDVQELYVGVYYTKGGIFKYRNGIGSTSAIQQIVGLDREKLDDFEIVKNIILEDNVFRPRKKVQEKPSLVNPNLDVESRVSADPKNKRDKALTATRGPAKKFIKLGGGNLDQDIRALSKKCKDASILYANTILPDALFEIIEKRGISNKPNVILRSVINQLYIDITAPTTVAEFENYNKLYEKIDMYYREKNKSDTRIFDNELKKEVMQFGEDTLKINKYIELMNDTRKKMNIDTEYGEVHFSMHIIDFLDFLDYLKRIRTNDKYAMEFKSIDATIATILQKSYVQKDSVILPRITDEIKQKLDETTKGVYTYLKISNFQEDGNAQFNSPYNERFNIKINFYDERSIVMEYSNINFGLYKKNTAVNKDLITSRRDPRISLKMGKDGTTMSEIESIAYDGKYTFGNFNKVFDPRYTVRDIANELKPLVEKVDSGKPLFLMGWGASGSGKTSTLISLAKKNEPGVLVYLCNMLGEIGYTTIYLSCKEMYKPYYGKENPNVSDEPVVEDYGGSDSFFKFNYDSDEQKELNKFKLGEGGANYPTLHQYRTKDDSKKFDGGANIGEVVNYLINVDRLVKATTNNPSSSRSHILCFLEFIKSDGNNTKKANIIIGDLAGVENKFNCENPNEISKFFNIKREGTTERFYKSEITEDRKVDVIYGGAPPQQLTLDDKASFYNSMNRPFFVFNDNSNLYNLYDSRFGGITFSTQAVALRAYVNRILSYFNIEGLSIETINKKILVMTKDSVQSARTDIEDTYNFDSNQIDEEPHLTIRQMIYGATGGEYKTESNIKNYTKEVFETVWNEENIEVLFKKIEECILYNSVIKNVCEHRVVEGTFINESLNSLSNDIVNIINYKNKDTVYFAPNIENSCLPAYCPSGKMCFSTDKNLNFDIQSLILKEIYNKLGYKLNKTFYEEIEFCVFCIFNWSRTANNPPPVPYVDINPLKQMIYRDDKASFDMNDFKSALNGRITELERNKYSSEALYALKRINAIIESRTTIDTKAIDDIKIQLGKIENTNATTAVGTIEFVDRLAKLNSISNSCFEGQKETDYMNIYAK